MTYKSALSVSGWEMSEIRHLFLLAAASEGLEGPRAYITKTNSLSFGGLRHRKGTNWLLLLCAGAGKAAADVRRLNICCWSRAGIGVRASCR